MKVLKFGAGIFGGTFILLITINLFNAINYFFHFIMARMLDAANYGVLVALMSMLYILNVFTESIQIVIAKYTSREKKLEKTKNILKRAMKRGFKIAMVFFLTYLVIAIFLSDFLRIEYSLLAFTGLFIFAVFLLPIGRGALQGRKKFNALGWNMIIEATVKILLAVLFVFLGWKVYGAIFAVFLGAVFAFIFSFASLKDVLRIKEEKTDTKAIYNYSLPVFIVMFTILAFYSLDVILAKAFFTDEIAGQYAIASTLSKIILFGTLPISKAMFPISSASKNEKTSKIILKKSLLILGATIAVALAVMWFFPELMVRIFSGSYYPNASGILFNLSVAMSLISFTNVILLYKLATRKIKNAWFLLVFLIVEVTMLSLFHANLAQYSVTLIFLNMLFLFGSIFLFNER